ncbi:putative Nudix hydrolase YfcD [Marinomonas aquimarina]|uniref:Putative Nudix hydrolase YfcD n=1 Tax=Marinomonas aquimarina TaxID=295068 RepID=A0A1A8TGP7_9GAMM|nr:NUDIX domain-containing protein [Marinomonas aquimarina]SBS32367.1 putative Nudix hydrolase YfcD [Marinomonas aquimarina]
MSETDEIITLVDRDNQVIGDIPRRLMNFQQDIHRVTFILVFTGPDTLLLQKRTDTKAFCPGYYGITTGGVVATGESYDLCASRELEEELGVQLPLTTQGMFFTEGEGFRIWGKVYTCEYNEMQHGPLNLQAKEVAEVCEMRIQDILDNPEQLPFTPDSYDALLHYVNDQLRAYDNVP